MPVIRRVEAGDFAEIAAIQAASPEAAQWGAESYALYDVWVALCGNRVAGFLAARSIDAGECELLNLAVSPDFRRQGVARALIQALTRGYQRTIFLEVRESNEAARKLYKSMGFQEIGTRPAYYDFPPEAAIVMKFHSC
ncbi:GCN5-related N-acetyltransferase [Candidatus Sulfopaludibacter sp. SbA3]|nr:GCN5-related N-acetyltransferase [Candidatus Sulfopaludibacter sp. SbA3]